MTRLPTDPIDPYESRLAGKVAEHTDRALQPFDAMAIAHAAAVARPRRRFGRLIGVATAFYRLGWVAAAALLGVMVIGGGGFVGGGATEPSPTVPAVTPSLVPSVAPTSAPTAVVTPAPTPTVRPIVACVPGDLTMEVLSWSGAAGQRVASLKLTNTGPVPCRFFSVTRPQLVDGTGSVLIDGTEVTGGSTLLLAIGASLTSMAEDGNYCGPDPVAPITVAIVLPDGGRIVAKPLSATDMTGLAPCMGSGSGAYIDMHEWQP
jgi:hypothetical protein